MRWLPVRGRCAAAFVFTAAAAGFAAGQSSFVNWETPHVAPLDRSPSGALLFAANTADNRLEVFDITLGVPVWQFSVPVGLDPVAVRARTDDEVWVVNHVSDSISIVDVAARNVIRTLNTGDEPTDVAFANGRAFVTLSQQNQVAVYNLADLSAAPALLNIEGEDPRALAVSPDGARVYAAIFDSGNSTTILTATQVSNLAGPYTGQNPPPNSGTQFDPPQRPGNPAPPPVALIVRRDPATGQWRDDNNRNWSSFVTWNLHDHDIAAIDTTTLAVTYINRLMNLNMHLAVRPDGRIVVVGTEALNHIRFESNVTGRFVRTMAAVVDPAAPTTPLIVDLNPHLADEYAAGIGTIPLVDRTESLADPRGVAWQPDGAAGYVAGMGSNSVACIDANGGRLATIPVGAGPTGVVVDASGQRVYVLNKFDATISTIDIATRAEIAVTPFHDPTPPEIRNGRPFMYDAILTSGLGVTACAACHVDTRMDPLAWDLGDPAGAVKPFNQICQGANCNDWHPMKGPLRTQTMQGLAGTEPFHWRGDRENLAAFNVGFTGLNGREAQLTTAELDAFVEFVMSVRFPPNPHRNVDGSLPVLVAGGNPVNGRQHFLNSPFDVHSLTCNQCHTLPNGTNREITPVNVLPTSPNVQAMKNSQLRNMHEKTGFSRTSQNSNLGFGFAHDGTIDTLVNFLRQPFFTRPTSGNGIPAGAAGDPIRLDLAAFLFALSTDTHPGVGVQRTLDGSNNTDPGIVAMLNTMLSLADGGAAGLVVKGRLGGVARGYAYIGGDTFLGDRLGDTLAATALRLAASAGSELTWTLVPPGSQWRIGVDRDLDGFFDGDEIDGCGDPANATIQPGHYQRCDANCDGAIDFFDIDPFLTALFTPVQYQLAFPNCHLRCNNDTNADQRVDFFDIDGFLECLFD